MHVYSIAKRREREAKGNDSGSDRHGRSKSCDHAERNAEPESCAEPESESGGESESGSEPKSEWKSESPTEADRVAESFTR